MPYVRPGEAAVSDHIYLSTSCLHGEHDYCKSAIVQELVPHWADDDSEILTRRKRPSECKFCAAPCVCKCHKESDEHA